MYKRNVQVVHLDDGFVYEEITNSRAFRNPQIISSQDLINGKKRISRNNICVVYPITSTFLPENNFKNIILTDPLNSPHIQGNFKSFYIISKPQKGQEIRFMPKKNPIVAKKRNLGRLETVSLENIPQRSLPGDYGIRYLDAPDDFHEKYCIARF